MDNPLSPTLADLQDLLTWQDGWNSYDALAPKPEAVARATTWIIELYQHLIAAQLQWLEPLISGGGDGEVTIHWYTEQQRDITIYIDADEQELHYVQCEGRGIGAKLTDGEITSIDDMLKLWQWLLETPQEKES